MNSPLQAADGLLYVLDLSGGRIFTVNPDGSDANVLLENCHYPDGIVIDDLAGHLYWTEMGVVNLNDGALKRADLDGSNRRTIVPSGATFTPKQLQLDRRHRKLYWCDREGMRIMRCGLDGSNLETLVQTGDPVADAGDQKRWCVGIAIDAERGHLYWTQKGADNSGTGRIFRTSITLPNGERPDSRSDIELLYEGLPEPIDIELDLERRLMYWTDRGDPPRGNTVNRAPMDAPAHGTRPEPDILFTHLMEGIGIALDLDRGRMFMTDLSGSVYSARLDGSERKTLLYARGNLTGIAYAAPQ
jgi:sugar lactone lactonase YvrE